MSQNANYLLIFDYFEKGIETDWISIYNVTVSSPTTKPGNSIFETNESTHIYNLYLVF